MTLTDTGPFVAIIDAGEPDHEVCVLALEELTPPLLTTWPVLTEALHLLGRSGGWRAQDALWALIERGDVTIAVPDVAQARRMRVLMAQYRDRPMDLADASLVALAEARRLRTIFTLDRVDFASYRLYGRTAFRTVP